jgi:hypothetical protein
MTSHANQADRNRPGHTDDVSYDSLERRNRLERQNRVFIEKLRAAILNGLETPAGVLGKSTARVGFHALLDQPGGWGDQPMAVICGRGCLYGHSH